MASSQLICGRAAGIGFVDAAIRYVPLSGSLGSGTSTVEARSQTPVRDAGVFRNLFVYVPTNTATVNTVITLRKSGVNTALTVTYTADQTGIKEDTTNSVTFAATDTGDWQIDVPTEAGTNTFTPTLICCEFVPDTTGNCISFMVTDAPATAGIALDSATRYIRPNGLLTVDSSVNNVNLRIRATFTASNFYVYVAINARTTDVVFRTTKNQVNGAQSVTYTSGQTGAKEDTVNTDSLVAGDNYQYSIVTLVGTESINPTIVCSRFVNTASIFQLVSASFLTQSFNVTNYFVASGDSTVTLTEADASMYPRFTFTASELGAFVSVNTIATSDTVVTLRDNLGNSIVTVSYAAAQTGLKNDSVNTTEITTGADEISYQVVTPNTSGSLDFRWLSVLGTAAAVTSLFDRQEHQYGRGFGRGYARSMG